MKKMIVIGTVAATFMATLGSAALLLKANGYTIRKVAGEAPCNPPDAYLTYLLSLRSNYNISTGLSTMCEEDLLDLLQEGILNKAKRGASAEYQEFYNKYSEIIQRTGGCDIDEMIEEAEKILV